MGFVFCSCSAAFVISEVRSAVSPPFLWCETAHTYTPWRLHSLSKVPLWIYLMPLGCIMIERISWQFSKIVQHSVPVVVRVDMVLFGTGIPVPVVVGQLKKDYATNNISNSHLRRAVAMWLVSDIM